ncbi:hypothetical protein JCM10908_001676 [Rhodotorula pacifica]|uniref:tetratricopeptide repeat protein n=1 Tax=Rhodotorula pacifica TaxID=1495444 RepID=UPI00317F5B61
MHSTATGAAAAAAATSPPPALSALSIPLPTFPVLPPPSIPDSMNQTFQTPSQVSAILSLPPPLLMQLARTDSPVEQRHIAEKRGVKSYLSAMAIPPPSPTSLVESIARENPAGFGPLAPESNGNGSDVFGNGEGAAGTGTGGGGDGAATQAGSGAMARPSLHIPLSIPLSLPNFTALATTADSLTAASGSDLASTSSGTGAAAAAAAAAASTSSNGQARLALPLLLGQVFAPPPLTPGVLAPIPGFGSVSSLFSSTFLNRDAPLPPDAGSTPTSPTSPLRTTAFAPSVDAWSLHTASQRAAAADSSDLAQQQQGPLDVGAPLDVGDLARQIKDWALETQERHVEVQVVEAKATAVVLAAQAQAQEAADAGTGLGNTVGGLVGPAALPSTAAETEDGNTRTAAPPRIRTTAQRDEDGLRVYAEAYKKQLDALASGYFAQLHRDALKRLEDETRSRAAAAAAATSTGGGAAAGASEGWVLPQTTSAALSAAGPSGDSSAFGSTTAAAGAFSTTAGVATAPLSSSQAPTLQSLTTLTSSRTQAEAMHVRASAAAAVAAQVMAAQDLARSAGEKLVELGVDPRKVVEEVGGLVDRRGSESSAKGLEEIIGKAVASASSRRGSRDERTAPQQQRAPLAAGLSPGSIEMQRTTSSGAKSDAMSIEDVGQPALPASLAGSTAHATAPPSSISADLHAAAPGLPTSGQASVADLASLPHADKPPSTARAPAAESSSAAAASSAATTGVAVPPAAGGAYPPQPQYGIPGQNTTAAEYAALATPEKRDYLLTYAHQLYSTEPHSPHLLPLLHTLEALHPDHLPTLLLISCVYYSRGELESSLYYNKRLLQNDPSYVEAMSNIGTTLRAMGRWSEAEKWWWKAIKLRPTYWDATENLLGVLCNPGATIPPGSTEAAALDSAPPAPRYREAIALCDYVESQIFAPPAAVEAPVVPSREAFLNPLANVTRPLLLPSTVPHNHTHRLQNLFYAKGNLKLALGDQAGAQDEYEKAIEIGLSLPEWARRVHGVQWPLEGCTTRDLVVAATVLAKLVALHAESKGRPDGAQVVADMAKHFGIAREDGSITFERLFRVVRRGGDAYAQRLLAMGGGVLPTVLLEPRSLAQLPSMLFPESKGCITSMFDPSVLSGRSGIDPARQGVLLSTHQTTSTMLLTLAKVIQDSLSPTATIRHTIGGIPASQSLLLPLYYVALALYPSPSTCNNLGILLSTLTATTVVATDDSAHPAALLTGQALALRYYEYGLKLDPKHPHLYTNLGSLLKDMGKLAEAVAMYKQAVTFNPGFDVALANLANAVKDMGQIQESIPYYRRAVALNPNFPEAVCGLVNALGGVCDWAGRGGVGEEWLVSEDNRLEFVPRQPNGQYARTGYMAQISRLVQKQLSDGYAYGVGSLSSYGGTKEWLELVSFALIGAPSTQMPNDMRNLWTTRLHRVLTVKDRRKVLLNEGGYLIRLIERLARRTQRRWYLTAYGQTVAYEAGQAVPGRVRASRADVEVYRRIPLPPSLPPIPVPTVLPFHCFTLPVTARETRLISHRTGLRISHSTLNQPWMPPIVYPPPRPPIDGKISLGYVSSDLGNHPLSHLMQSVFGMHDLSRFNVFVYATSPSDQSPYRLKIESESQNFVNVSAMSTQQIVERIVHDEIHVLINLSGYTKGARNEVFAARPSPVQMSYMGFASTLSAGWCDYFIVDPIVCPPKLVSGNQWRQIANVQQNPRPPRIPDITEFEGDPDPEGSSEDYVYTEKLIYLPHSYFVTDHKQAWREEDLVSAVPGEAPVTSSEPPTAEVAWAIEEHKRWQMRRQMFPQLRDDTIIFANWNQLYKIDPFIFRLWLSILQKHPNSILWLLRFPAPGEQHLKETAARWAGQDVADRVIFTDVANKNEHIHRGRIADLFLDTTECNAHTTAADILWSGTPILTYPRHLHKMCSRVAASIAAATGFGQEMIVPSDSEYERRALELAGSLVYEYTPPDPSKPPHSLEAHEQRRSRGELADLRKKLFLTREHSPLFDTKRWVHNLEKGLVEAWRRYVSGAEFEDSPEWGRGNELKGASIWITDDQDGANWERREPYSQ